MHCASTVRARAIASGLLAIMAGCSPPKADTARETGTASQDSTVDLAESGPVVKGMVPLSTKSDEARKLYDQGLTLADQLRAHDARQLFQKAVAKDPDFAMAHYQLALNSPSPREFRGHLNQAAALSDRASAGERLAILSLKAGADANPAKSLDYAREAASKYPD